MGNVAKYQHGWNMTFTVVELLMIIPKSTYLSISLPYFSIYHFFSLTLLCKIIQNIRFRAPIFNQSLQESEHKKACILSHNVFSHQSVSSSKRASTGASGGGKIFSQAFACIFGPKELLIIKEPGNTTTGTHNSKN